MNKTTYWSCVEYLLKIQLEAYQSSHSVPNTIELHLSGRWLSGSPIIRMGLGFSKFVEILQKLTCLEITGYQIKYSTVLWLLEFQTRRGRKV